MSEHDLVLVGATGFVGRLTAAQLARHAPPGLRIALAGRSAERLADLRAELSAELGAEPRAEYRSTPADWPLLTVDLTDPEAVDRLAGSSRVVATAAGPYARYGLPLVQACARHGIGYADLTGETLFVRRSIELAHETAVRSGAPIVHACGFDSIPSDLGVALTAERAAADGQGTLTATVLHVRTLRGGSVAARSTRCASN